jgi:hypothetical protein
VSLQIPFEGVITRVRRCNWRLRSVSEPRETFRGCDQASFEMHFEAVVDGVCRCTWQLRLSELKDTLRGRD